MKIPQNTHLLFSSSVLTLVALGYGIVPEQVLPLLTTLDVRPVDGFHVFRAIMGLYLGCAACWLVGAMRPVYWRAATWMNVLFMGGLAGGRLLSVLVDGIPSPALWLGLLAEAMLAAWGLRNLKFRDPFPGNNGGW